MRADTDYTTYLRIDDLLALQRPLTPGAHDEMLFIVVHQVYELWFKLVLWELDSARDAMLGGRSGVALAAVRRAVTVEALMVDQLRLIETMSPERFMEFRDPLAPASGFQSTQFREIEILGGRGAAALDAATSQSPAQRGRLEERAAQPDLYAAFRACMERHGLAMPGGDDDGARARREESLVDLYRSHDDAERALLHALCEALLDHDETVARWRHGHVLMAAREIGTRTGTGGSAGVEYLQSTLNARFFPELWAVRTAL